MSQIYAGLDADLVCGPKPALRLHFDEDTQELYNMNKLNAVTEDLRKKIACTFVLLKKNNTYFKKILSENNLIKDTKRIISTSLLNKKLSIEINLHLQKLFKVDTKLLYKLEEIRRLKNNSDSLKLLMNEFSCIQSTAQFINQTSDKNNSISFGYESLLKENVINNHTAILEDVCDQSDSMSKDLRFFSESSSLQLNESNYERISPLLRYISPQTEFGNLPFFNSIMKYIKNLNALENNLKQAEYIQSHKKNHEIIKKTESFLEDVAKMINKEKYNFTLNLIQISFDFINLTNLILNHSLLEDDSRTTNTDSYNFNQSLKSTSNIFKLVENDFNKIYKSNKKQQQILNRFDTDLNSLFKSYNLSELSDSTKKKQLLISIELIKQSFCVIHIAKCSIENKDDIISDECVLKMSDYFENINLSSDNSYEEINSFDDLFKSISKNITNTKSSFELVLDKISNKPDNSQLVIELNKDLKDTLTKSDDLNIISECLDYASLKLIQKTTEYALNIKRINNLVDENCSNKSFKEIKVNKQHIEVDLLFCKLIVQDDTFQNETNLNINNDKFDLTNLLDLNKISNLFEIKLENSSIFLNKPLILKLLNLDCCLFVQKKSNNEDTLLNKWSILIPNRILSDNSIEYDLKNLDLMFFGKMDNGLEVDYIKQVHFNSFRQIFKSYKYIKPGLNLKTICNKCFKMVVINRGYGDFKLNEEIECPECKKIINKEFELKILYQAEGTFNYTDKSNQLKETSFKTNENDLILYGNNENKLDNFKIKKQICENDLTSKINHIIQNSNLNDQNTILPSNEFIERLCDKNARLGMPHIALSWHNENDLDLHVIDPNGEEIYYGHKLSKSGGELDVDANAGHPKTKTPIENIYWSISKPPPKGLYQVFVNYYSKHCSNDETDFKVSIMTENNKRVEIENSVSLTHRKKKIYEFRI